MLYSVPNQIHKCFNPPPPPPQVESFGSELESRTAGTHTPEIMCFLVWWSVTSVRQTFWFTLIIPHCERLTRKLCSKLNGGIFLCTSFNTASSAAPRTITYWRTAGIKPRTVATLTLAVRHSEPLS